MNIRVRYLVLGGIALFVIVMLLASLATNAAIGANVAVIPIKGPILTETDQGLFAATATGSSETVRFLEQARDDPRIEAVVLEINSPGGSAVASDEIATAVAGLDKPVVAWIRESGASGAYWIASEADHIIANRMSITGSVGVLASYLEFNEFLEEYNVTYRRLTGGEHKDIGSPFAELTQEQEALLEAKIDRIHAFFLEAVAENRNLTEEQVAEIDSGIFYLGIEAYDLGLVDELGGRDAVTEYLTETLGDEPSFVRYEREQSLFEALASARTTMTPDLLGGLRIVS